MIEIEITGEITGETAAMVREALTEPGDVLVTIDSGGGNMIAGLRIYDMLLERRTTIRVKSEAHSAASIIALAGMDKPMVSDSSMMRIHNPYVDGNVTGDYKALESLSKYLEKYTQVFAEIYQSKFDVPIGIIKEMMESEITFSGNELVSMGVATNEINENIMAKENSNMLDSILAKLGSKNSVKAEEKTEEEEVSFTERQLEAINKMIDEKVAQTKKEVSEEVSEEAAEALVKILAEMKGEDTAPSRSAGEKKDKEAAGVEAHFRAIQNKIKANQSKLLMR